MTEEERELRDSIEEGGGHCYGFKLASHGLLPEFYLVEVVSREYVTRCLEEDLDHRGLHPDLIQSNPNQ